MAAKDAFSYQLKVDETPQDFSSRIAPVPEDDRDAPASERSCPDLQQASVWWALLNETALNAQRVLAAGWSEHTRDHRSRFSHSQINNA